MQKLQSYAEMRHRYLQNWAFSETSMPPVASTLEKLIDCLRTLYEQVKYKHDFFFSCTLVSILLASHFACELGLAGCPTVSRLMF